MLGKLIKYDMKALNHFLILIHAFLLLSAVLGRLLLTSRIDISANSPESDTNALLLILAILIFSFIIMGASFATYIIIAVRFYKNMYSDEGYLSHTLPVTKGQHLLSKTISGSIWACVDMILLFVSLLIVIATPSVIASYQESQEEILHILGFGTRVTLPSFCILLLLLLLVSCISSVIFMYVSISCGQLFSGHRILGAIVSYFALQTVFSVIVILIMTVCGYFNTTLFFQNSTSGTDTEVYFADAMQQTLYISGIMTLIIMVVLYLTTYYILKKKTNLQ